MLKIKYTSRDFTEDEHLENGAYHCYCGTCKLQFIGYKRRVVCKVCENDGGSAVIEINYCPSCGKNLK